MSTRCLCLLRCITQYSNRAQGMCALCVFVLCYAVTQYSNRAQGTCTLYVCVLCYAVSPSTATELRVCVHSTFFVTLCHPVQQRSSWYVYTLCLCSLLWFDTQCSNGAQGMCTLYVCVLCTPVFVYTLCCLLCCGALYSNTPWGMCTLCVVYCAV